MGVDLGGVLLAKVPGRMLQTIRTPPTVARMLAVAGQSVHHQLRGLAEVEGRVRQIPDGCWRIDGSNGRSR
jgi:hypothetical protein